MIDTIEYNTTMNDAALTQDEKAAKIQDIVAQHVKEATARNPLFILTFGPYREMAATLGVLRVRRWFKVVKPTKRKPT